MAKKQLTKKRTILSRSKEGLDITEERALALYLANKCIDLPGCLVKAGYEGNSNVKASRLKNSKKAKNYLEPRIDKALKKVNKTAEDVLDEISLIAFLIQKHYSRKMSLGKQW